MRAVLTPPSPSEYGSFYEKYITTVREEDLADVLAAQPEILRAAAETLSEEAALRRYAPGKWSVKEVVGHLVDAERIFAELSARHDGSLDHLASLGALYELRARRAWLADVSRRLSPRPG